MHDFRIHRGVRNSIKITVSPDGYVDVYCPQLMPWDEVCEFVEEHGDWIDERLEQVDEYSKWSVSPLGIALLTTRAREYVPQRVEYWSKLMNVRPAGVKITKARKRLGSCSSQNNLSFSYLLGGYTMDAIDYVVVHELAHLIYKNHSREFYGFVEMYMPDRVEREKLLHQKAGEFWRLYDEHKRPLEEFVMRGDPIPVGRFHIVVNVSLFDMKGRMLIQKRADTKDTYPGLWDVSTCGNVRFGEVGPMAAEREVKEELGVKVNLQHGHRAALITTSPKTFTEFFIKKCRLPIEKLSLNSDEVAQVRYATKEEIMELMDAGKFVPYNKSLINLIFDTSEGKGIV